MAQSHHYNDKEILERLRSGDRALMAALKHLVSHVMVPQPDNFTPPSLTPWGGTRILTEIKRDLNIHPLPTIVGESWEISAHPRFPSCFSFVCEGREMRVSFPTLESIFPELHLPYLVKLINTWGDKPRGNMSVQVHPPAGDPDLKPGEHTKTEAWVIIDAEPGAGIYLGLKEDVGRSEFEHALTEGKDVTVFLNFIEVKSGDVFFVPAGIIHAIGAGVLLLEPQESSDTTYRIYDSGRTDARGNPRQLHVERAMAVAQWDGLRGGAAVAALRRYPKPVVGHQGAALVESLLGEDAFTMSRITLHPQQEIKFDSTRGLSSCVVLSGTVTVLVNGRRDCELHGGQSCIVPKFLGDCTFTNQGKSFSVIFEVSAP